MCGESKSKCDHVGLHENNAGCDMRCSDVLASSCYDIAKQIDMDYMSRRAKENCNTNMITDIIRYKMTR